MRPIICDRCRDGLDLKATATTAHVVFEAALTGRTALGPIHVDLCARHVAELRRWLTEVEIRDRAA